MRRIFNQYLGIIVALAVLAMGAFHYGMATRNIENEMRGSAQQQIDQVADMLQANEVELSNLWDSLAEDYLTRAKAFAYIIEQNPNVLESQEELDKIRKLLNVDELHVVDENGFLRYGTEEKYFDFDFSTTEQTSAFLQILEDPTITLVQDIMPNGAEQAIMQYVGVARLDAPGIVQVGIAPERYIEAMRRNEYDYIFERIPMEEYWFIEAIDSQTGEIVGTTSPDKMGHGGDDNARKKGLVAYQGGSFFSGLTQNSWWTIKEYPNLGLYLCMATDKSVLTDRRNEQIFFMMLYLIAIFVVVLFSINYLIKKKIIDGIVRISHAMQSITDGNLDVVVQESGNPEFELLSSHINQMVSSILHTTARISNIIDMVDAPIGSFEYMEDMSRVLMTNRLQEVIGISDEEAKQLFGSKKDFCNKLEMLMRFETEEEGIYLVSESPKKWLKIQLATENRRTFGIITDVTADMLKKEELRRKIDYDMLTGLCNRRAFEERVKRVLDSQEDIREAAMIMLDLDAFKAINDTYGHEFGDEYLRFIADRLREEREENCIIGRRSGDEFYIFTYREESKDEIRKRLQRLYIRLEQMPIILPDKEERVVQISAGLAFYGAQCQEYEALVNEADIMLYRMKRDGKGYYREEV